VIGGLILIVLMYVLSIPMLQLLKKRKAWFSLKLMKKLYWFHMFFAGVYYVMVMSSPSDSVGYYQRPQAILEGWFSVYDTGTPFVDFVGFPFINYMGFTYEMMMALFAWLGYWGFVYFYIFFKENLQHKHSFKGIDLVTLILFLPNMHYWTASLGKGSIIFFGLGMAMYGISSLNNRKVALVIGMLLVYHVRPHVFLFMAIAIVIGFITGRQKIPVYQKLMVLAGGTAALVLLYDQILGFVNLDSENLLESFDQFSNTRAYELSKAGSGIDISNYPLFLKLLTFWFRPLFFDSPGPVGLIVSFENVFYLFLASKLFQGGVIGYLRKSSAMVKTCAVVFLATSFALSGTLSNLGIIIRQKSMVMYFFLFIVLSFMDYKKHKKIFKKQPVPGHGSELIALPAT
jgi:hypothetical protein